MIAYLTIESHNTGAYLRYCGLSNTTHMSVLSLDEAAGMAEGVLFLILVTMILAIIKPAGDSADGIGLSLLAFCTIVIIASSVGYVVNIREVWTRTWRWRTSLAIASCATAFIIAWISGPIGDPRSCFP